jgi:hypothetical protein
MTDYQATYFRAYKSTWGSEHGILGVVTSCTVNHNLEGGDGVFTKRVEDSELGPTVHPNTILPKLIDINISFTPLHEFTPYYKNSKPDGGTPIYPYGVKLGDIRSQGRREVEQGKTLKELIAVRESAEEKRRKAASAQQEADKAKAKAARASRRLGRRGGNMSPERIERLEGNVEAFASAQEEADSYTTQAENLEELI